VTSVARSQWRRVKGRHKARAKSRIVDLIGHVGTAIPLVAPLLCAVNCKRNVAGWVHADKIVDKIDVQHGLENAPATLRRLFEGRNEGKQLLRVAE